MGSTLQARCGSCGLDQEFHAGGGFGNFMAVAAVPAACGTCRSLVTVNAMLPRPYGCPTEGCSGHPLIIGEILGKGDLATTDSVFDWLVDDKEGTRFVLHEGPHACPACGASGLSFVQVGFWD
jgi:hypothetical protein